MKVTNNYIGAKKAQVLAENRAYFTRCQPANGGYFDTNEGQKKINEKVFQTIKQYLKPRL